MKTKNWIKWLVLLISIVFIGACSNGGSDDPLADNDTSGTGYLALSMVDAPGDEYQAVYVSIKEVQVCIAPEECDGSGDCEENCDWQTVAQVNETFNLIELVNGVMASLGLKELASGQYNQMRLMLSDTADDGLNILGEEHPYPQYLIDEAGDVHEMKVPSGYQSGIKLVHPFEIVSGLTTELILDFDVSRSVVKAGNSGKYNLKPTIKVIGTYNRASVTGTVYAAGDPLVPTLGGATVTAWHETAEDVWSAAMTTATDEEGGYMLYLDLGGDYKLDPKSYKLVAFTNGYIPSCFILPVEVDQTYANKDFMLEATEMVTVMGTVSGTADVDLNAEPVVYPTVTISFSRLNEEEGCLPTVQFFKEITSDLYDSENDRFEFQFSENLAAGNEELTGGNYEVTLSWDDVIVGPNTVEIVAPGPVEIVFPQQTQQGT